jgi:hypothetical protein
MIGAVAAAAAGGGIAEVARAGRGSQRSNAAIQLSGGPSHS